MEFAHSSHRSMACFRMIKLSMRPRYDCTSSIGSRDFTEGQGRHSGRERPQASGIGPRWDLKIEERRRWSLVRASWGLRGRRMLHGELSGVIHDAAIGEREDPQPGDGTCDTNNRCK